MTDWKSIVHEHKRLVWHTVYRLLGNDADALDCFQVEELGQRQVDGRDAVGFRLRVENIEMTVWADPVTALPVRVESTRGIMDPKYHHVMTDFRFNVNLDESLFSVEPPEGYLVQEVNMDASAPGERDLIEMLRTYCAEQENGLFPPTLAMTEIMQGVTHGIQKEIDDRFGDWRADAKLREEVLQSEEYEQFMALSMKLGRGLGFLQEMPRDVDWRYAGKNIKLGTPARPIFWYRSTDSENYRVIYADLSVKEVTAEELKRFPEASGPA